MSNHNKKINGKLEVNFNPPISPFEKGGLRGICSGLIYQDGLKAGVIGC